MCLRPGVPCVCVWEDGVDGDESGVGWVRTWPGETVAAGEVVGVVGGGLQFCTCVGQTRISSTWKQITHVLFPSAITLIQLFVKDALFLEFIVCLVQPQCGARIFDRVVCVRLDILSEDEPREETERETALAVTEEVEVDGVNHLVGRDENVYYMAWNETWNVTDKFETD